MSSKTLRESARLVQAALTNLGFSLEVVELPSSTRTAAEAARAIGCQVGQIAKSLVLRGQASGKPVMVIASGSNRVDEAHLASLHGESLQMADAGFVRAQTGFAIGGVPPVGHSRALPTYIDQDLLEFDEIWAAAGTPQAVFRLTPSDLVRMTSGRIVSVRRS